MAIQSNPIFAGYRGTINGQLLLRQCGGKTVVSSLPDPKKAIFTPAQLSEQQRFRQAVSFARVVVSLPLLKARYAEKASKLGFRTAWNVAIAEYMSKTELQQKPKKIWFDSKIITDSLGYKVKVKLYTYVYPEAKSQSKDALEAQLLLPEYAGTLAYQNTG